MFQPFPIYLKDWLGELYLTRLQSILNTQIETSDGWTLLKQDLTQSIDPTRAFFARFFVTMFLINFELLHEEIVWPYSSFAVVPDDEPVEGLKEDDLPPMRIDSESYETFFRALFEETELARDSEQQQPINAQTTNLYELFKALLPNEDWGQSSSTESVQPIEAIIGRWDLDGATLNFPFPLSEADGYMITAHQAAIFGRQPAALYSIRRTFQEASLPYWMLPPRTDRP